MATPYTTCDYLSRKGICDKRCFGGRCNIHRKKKSLAYCLGDCGNITGSISGWCADRETCGWKQGDVAKKMRRERKEEAAYLKEILSWDWVGYHRRQWPGVELITPPAAESATAGSEASADTSPRSSIELSTRESASD
jgi:hypothetical protein